MPSSSRILLFYDGTAESRAALLRCAELALALAAPVDVVAVVDFVDANAACAGMLSGLTAAQMEEQAHSALKDAIDELGLNGAVARGHIMFGRVTDSILRTIQLLKSDVIVVGHRARTRLARWYGDRPVHADLVDKLKGPMIVTVTLT